MNEAEKELTVETLKQFFRNSYQHDVAEEMCDRLDAAKKHADSFEQIMTLFQQQCEQFCQAYMNIVLPSK